jgi:DNA-binding LacI/PurR family transcriptional regulator
MPKLEPHRSATLADVAKAAGVSKGTASNVFNRPGIVREEVRERVLLAARTAGYNGPDPRGRMLSAGKVNAIGVATTEPLSYFFADPFARVLMKGVTEAVDANGVGISLVSAASEKELAWNMRNAVVDGFILLCLEGADTLVEASRERNLPFVALSLNDTEASAIGVDNRAGARLAAKHLTDLGHRRFAILSMELVDDRHGFADMGMVDDALYRTSAERIHGYFDVLSQFGLGPETVPIYETVSADAGTVAAGLDAIFAADEPPTAILAESDRIAFAAMDWLKARGLDVPNDVSIVGFDGVPEAALSQPPLTTVQQPIEAIGRRAVEGMLRHGTAMWRETLDVELAVRGSTGKPRG